MYLSQFDPQDLVSSLPGMLQASQGGPGGSKKKAERDRRRSGGFDMREEANPPTSRTRHAQVADSELRIETERPTDWARTPGSELRCSSHLSRQAREEISEPHS